MFHSHSVSQHYYNLAILLGLQFNVCFIASSTVVAGRCAQIIWTDWSLMSVKLHTSWNKMWRKLWIVVRGLMTFRHALVRRSVLRYHVHAWTWKCNSLIAIVCTYVWLLSCSCILYIIVYICEWCWCVIWCLLKLADSIDLYNCIDWLESYFYFKIPVVGILLLFLNPHLRDFLHFWSPKKVM